MIEIIKCGICGNSPAPYMEKSSLTPEQHEEIKAYHASFRDENGNPFYHTGHLKPGLMELPRRHLCESCKEND